MNEREEQIAALIREGKTTKQIMAAVSCSPNTVAKVRRLLADGAPADEEVHETTAIVVSDAPPRGRKAERERVTELEEEVQAYQARVLELIEHVVELSMENVRITRALREQQEAAGGVT